MTFKICKVQRLFLNISSTLCNNIDGESTVLWQAWTMQKAWKEEEAAASAENVQWQQSHLFLCAHDLYLATKGYSKFCHQKIQFSYDLEIIRLTDKLLHIKREEQKQILLPSFFFIKQIICPPFHETNTTIGVSTHIASTHLPDTLYSQGTNNSDLQQCSGSLPVLQYSLPFFRF